MVKKLLTLLLSSAVIFLLSTPVPAQAAQAKAEKAKAPKPDRWEGFVVVKSTAKSSLTVRQSQGTSIEKTVAYDASTKWTSQEHGSKKVNTIDASHVNEGDRVICIGTMGKDGVLHASMISKRLTKALTR